MKKKKLKKKLNKAKGKTSSLQESCANLKALVASLREEIKTLTAGFVAAEDDNPLDIVVVKPDPPKEKEKIVEKKHKAKVTEAKKKELRAKREKAKEKVSKSGVFKHMKKEGK